jgi:hypothetical protein
MFLDENFAHAHHQQHTTFLPGDWGGSKLRYECKIEMYDILFPADLQALGITFFYFF